MASFVIFEDSSKSNFGGGQKVSFELIKNIKKLNYDVHLIDFTRSSSFYLQLKKISNSNLVLKKSNKSKRTLNNSFTFSIIEISINIFLFPINIFLLFFFFRKIIIKEKLFIICTTKKTMFYGFFLKLFYPKYFVIFHIHNYLKDVFIWSFLLRKLINFSDDNWFVSASVKSSYGNRAKGKILYNPVDLNFVSKSKNNHSKVHVGIVANLLGYKGVDYFVKSYFLIPDKYRDNFVFHVFGDGPEKNKLISLSKNNCNIHFHGFVANSLIYQYIDILVCSSIDEEAFSLVIFEAIKHSIPVIATDLKVHREFFSIDAIYFVNPKSDIEIANAIIDISSNHNLVEKMTICAQNEVNELFKENFESNVSSLISSLLNIKIL